MSLWADSVWDTSPYMTFIEGDMKASVLTNEFHFDTIRKIVSEISDEYTLSEVGFYCKGYDGTYRILSAENLEEYTNRLQFTLAEFVVHFNNKADAMIFKLKYNDILLGDNNGT